MNTHDLLATAIVLVGLLAAFGLARSLYLLAVFKITAEKRETVLKSVYLLDEKHALNTRELAFLAGAIENVYNYRTKRRMAYAALRAVCGSKAIPKSDIPMRDEVRQVAMAFSAMTLWENPLCAIRLLVHIVKQTKGTKLARDKGPLARAESVVAEQTPVFADRRSRFHDEVVAC